MEIKELPVKWKHKNNSKLNKEPCQIYYKPHPRENNTIADLVVKYNYPLFIIDKKSCNRLAKLLKKTQQTLNNSKILLDYRYRKV